MFTLFMTTTHKIYISEFMPILLAFLRLLSKSFIVTDTPLSTSPQWETAPSDILWSHQQPLAKFNTTGDRNSTGNYY